MFGFSMNSAKVGFSNVVSKGKVLETSTIQGLLLSQLLSVELLLAWKESRVHMLVVGRVG